MKQDEALEGVSRETIEQLHKLELLLLKWNPTINLVAKSTLANLWSRHFVDSAQLYELGKHGSWLDLGSGGGFPGLVVAVLAEAGEQSFKLTLVESDQRKATFLRTALRELGLTAQVIPARIEQIPPQMADTISARALAPLTKLLEYSARHLKPDGHCLFPKGANWREEVEAARHKWHFDHTTYPSKTDPDGAILVVKAIQHV